MGLGSGCTLRCKLLGPKGGLNAERMVHAWVGWQVRGGAYPPHDGGAYLSPRVLHTSRTASSSSDSAMCTCAADGVSGVCHALMGLRAPQTQAERRTWLGRQCLPRLSVPSSPLLLLLMRPAPSEVGSAPKRMACATPAPSKARSSTAVRMPRACCLLL